MEGESAADPPGPERKIVRRCLWVLGFLGTGSAIGVAFSLYLVNHAPLLLVALSPLGRNVMLAVPNVSPALLLPVVVVRRMVFYLASFYLGRELGPAGITWIEARGRWLGRFVRFLERLFARAPRLVVLAFTGPTVSALAGISGMRVGVYASLAGLGLTARMGVTIWFAELLREPLEWLLALIDEYWVPGTVVLASAVFLYRWHQLRHPPRPKPN